MLFGISGFIFSMRLNESSRGIYVEFFYKFNFVI